MAALADPSQTKATDNVDSPPLVSAIIPVYNGEQYLREAIESALAQRYRPLEVIIVDDGSTDASGEIARCFAGVRCIRQENLGVSRRVAGFVLTLGSTANQNGTALFEGVTVLFLAQFFGIELTTTQQIMVVLASVLAGIGTAGVPGGSLPVIVLVLQSVGVPGEGIGVILGVDRFLDMCRTTVNVTGDITAALYVEKRETNAGRGLRNPVPPHP